uniref:Uncharacterized protein n=1 Tax=Rhizophora mucronata TaxID=61149 RepID=A0A2P2R4T0_RHIMU
MHWRKYVKEMRPYHMLCHSKCLCCQLQV